MAASTGVLTQEQMYFRIVAHTLLRVAHFNSLLHYSANTINRGRFGVCIFDLWQRFQHPAREVVRQGL